MSPEKLGELHPEWSTAAPPTFWEDWGEGLGSRPGLGETEV